MRNVGFLLLALSTGISTPLFADEPTVGGAERDALRARFREGLERYTAGDIHSAIAIWEPVFEQLGPKDGYRLAFNLARAYEAVGRDVDAAECFSMHLQEVSQRVLRSEALEPIVLEQEQVSKDHLASIVHRVGRLDFHAWPLPTRILVDGKERHRIGDTVFAQAGRRILWIQSSLGSTTRELDVFSGQVVAVSGVSPIAPRQKASPTDAKKPPISPGVVYVSAGLTALSVVLPIVAYNRAAGIQDDYSNAQDRLDTQAQDRLRGEYDSARTLAYGSLAIPITLGVVTGILTAYYFLGPRRASEASARTPLIVRF